MNENRFVILLVTLVLMNIQVFGQTRNCETVYNTVDNNPTYEGGMNQLMAYTGKYIAPIISKYHKMDNEFTGKMTITLTIDMDGKVIDAVLLNHEMSKDCAEELKKQLLTMNGWIPGNLDGQKVCSQFSCVTRGIKWG